MTWSYDQLAIYCNRPNPTEQPARPEVTGCQIKALKNQFRLRLHHWGTPLSHWTQTDAFRNHGDKHVSSRRSPITPKAAQLKETIVAFDTNQRTLDPRTIPLSAIRLSPLRQGCAFEWHHCHMQHQQTRNGTTGTRSGPARRRHESTATATSALATPSGLTSITVRRLDGERPRYWLDGEGIHVANRSLWECRCILQGARRHQEHVHYFT